MQKSNVGLSASEGAVLLNSGYAVLGKILAGIGKIKFTQARLDGGELPPGTVAEALTEPCQYVGDGLIASCENTGDGVATIVVQVSSMGLEDGLTIKGVMLFVENPEGGDDVAYSYLPLQSDPVWIRPEGSPVNKFVSFEIENIVSSASSVVAVINPAALARAVDLEAFVRRTVSMTSALISVPVAAWAQASGTAGRWAYYADVLVDGLTMQQRPDLVLDNTSLEISASCGMAPLVQTLEDGKIRLLAQAKPKAAITGICYLLKGETAQ